jgi:hypothetical protein
VATFNLAPGYTQFMGFCAKAQVNYAEEQVNPIICLPAQAVSDNGDSGSKNKYEQPNADSGLARPMVNAHSI